MSGWEGARGEGGGEGMRDACNLEKRQREGRGKGNKDELEGFFWVGGIGRRRKSEEGDGG